jgi:hypothetical protein
MRNQAKNLFGTLTALLVLFVCGMNISVAVAQQNIRPVSGEPGSDYWQQKVDYSVKASLHPEKRSLQGTARITYHNNSPETLNEIYWHLYYNVFNKNSDEYQAGAGSRLGSPTDGITIQEVRMGDTTVKPDIDGTLMRTELPQPLEPGQKAVITVTWTLDFPPYASLRTGSMGRDFSLTQWYPQIAVFDDRRGWDKTPYTGAAEFYLEYGDWDVAVEVPSNYTLAATGTLQNPEEVLSQAQVRRYRSVSQDSVSRIITQAEAVERSQQQVSTTKTWEFAAKSVRDFAVAASPAYIWRATKTEAIGQQKDGVFIHAFFQANGLPAWNEGADMARHAIEHFSEHFGPYVYPQATVVSGPVTGMEYPMMVYAGNQGPVVNILYELIAHELGHEWYPMMIGSDESHHAFMDEGFNTYITSTAFEDRYPEHGFMNPSNPDWITKLVPHIDERLMNQTMYLTQARANEDASISAPSNRVDPARYNVASYAKPGSVLYMLRHYLGDETFARAMQTYYDRWLFKHPYPEDFYRTVEDVADEDLSWFWDQFMVQTWNLDQALKGIDQQATSEGYAATLELQNNGQARMPMSVVLHLEDGSTKKVTVPRDAQIKQSFTYRVSDLSSKIKTAEIDPDLWNSDTDRLNNTWPVPRVTLQAKPYFLVEQMPPLNAYWMGLYPNLWYSGVDGLELGLAGRSSYMGTDYRLRWSATMGTKNGQLDGMLYYDSTVPFIEQPGFRWGIGGYHIDGRRGGDLTMSIAPGTFGTALGDHGDASWKIKLLWNDTFDTDYLYRPQEWLHGTWKALRTEYEHSERTPVGLMALTLGAEAGGPDTDFAYGKVWGDMRWSASLSSNWKLRARVFGGHGSGQIPNQTGFYLAQASPYERFSNRLLRSDGILNAMNIASQTLQGGGGAVLSADPMTRGNNLLALNTSVDYSTGPLWLNLFYNSGEAWNSGSFDGDLLRHEIGIGGGFTLPSKIGGYDVGNWGLYLASPMLIKRPGYKMAFDPVFKIVLGHRWGL